MFCLCVQLASTTKTMGDPSKSESRERSGVYEISASRYVPALDGLRAIAVLLVIGSHYWHIFARGPYDLFGKLAQWGLTGVDLFFVLSGFLITGILFDARGGRACLRNFYARRVLRIFPLYYCTLVLIYLVLPAFHLTAWTPWQNSAWVLGLPAEHPDDICAWHRGRAKAFLLPSGRGTLLPSVAVHRVAL